MAIIITKKILFLGFTKCSTFQSTDAGEYKCVATNDAGMSEGVAMLTVRGIQLNLTIMSSDKYGY